MTGVTRYMPYLSGTKIIFRLQNIVSDRIKSFLHYIRRSFHKKTDDSMLVTFYLIAFK